MSTINPSFVFGPQSFGSEIKQSLNTSSEIINSILKLKPNDSIPASKGGWVDVRDVAKAHIIAFENEDAKIKRILLNSGRFTSQSLVDIINDKFPDLKGKYQLVNQVQINLLLLKVWLLLMIPNLVNY